MIGITNILGSSPISSVLSAGFSEFTSILRKKPSKAFGGSGSDVSDSRYPRPYTSQRGVLTHKDWMYNPDVRSAYYFQFNPQTITDTKETRYSTRQYAGLSYVDYIWGGGGERTISFQLFLDDTPYSKRYNESPKPHTLKSIWDGATPKKDYFGKDLVDEFVSQGKSMYEGFIPSKKPTSLEFVNNGAYSLSRIRERGVLPDVELIQSFLHAAPMGDEATPLFAEGGIVNKHQFRPPSTAYISIGPMFLEGVIKSAPVTYTLFDSDLTPIRATMDIEFAVFEFEELMNLSWLGI